MNKFTYCSLAASISLLSACGGGSSDSGGTTPQNNATTTVSYEAYVVDDYVIGGKAEFFDLATNQKVAEAQTQELGKIQTNLDASKNYRIKITGGFIDADGLNSTTTDRMPFASEITGLIGKDGTARVNILGSVSTGLESFSQGNVATYEAQMAEINKTVAQYLSKTDGSDINKVKAALENAITLNKMTNFEQVKDELRDDGALNNSHGITTENAKALVSMAETSRAVAFADPALFACIQQKLKSNLAPTVAQLESITTLFCNNAEVRTLKGIEQLKNVTDLDVSYNQISDLSVLGGLPKLAWVNAMSNRVSDMSVAANTLKNKGVAINISDNCMTAIPNVEGVFIAGGLDTQRETCGSVKLNLWAFQAVRKTLDTLNLSYKLDNHNNSGCKLELPNGSNVDITCDNKPHKQTVTLNKTQENEIVRLLVGGKPVATYQVFQRIPVPVTISDYSPKQAKINTPTTFTLRGTGFVSGMGYTVEDCDTVSTPTITATSFSFTCTPKANGDKHLIVKDKPNGTELYNKVVVVSEVIATPTCANAVSSAICEDFNGSVAKGTASGVTFVSSPNGQAASFSRVSESRIQYPFSSGLPKEGTLEFIAKIDAMYRYENYVMKTNEACALLFTTDIQGGDVTWPGSAWLYVCNNGDVSFHIAGEKYEPGHQAKYRMEAKATSFRFGEWHRVGVSYGSQGRYISVNGQIVASSTTQTQQLGAGGTHSSPIDTPTIGEPVPGFWKNNQWEGGFEGAVDAFRASATQKDWHLSK